MLVQPFDHCMVPIDLRVVRGNSATAQGNMVLPVPVAAGNQRFTGWDQVRDPHSLFPNITPGSRDIPAKRHRVLKFRRKWKDSQQIPVLERSLETRRIEGELLNPAVAVVLNPLQNGTPDPGYVGQAAGALQRRSNRGFAFELINARFVHIPAYSHLCSYGRNVDHISGK